MKPSGVFLGLALLLGVVGVSAIQAKAPGYLLEIKNDTRGAIVVEGMGLGRNPRVRIARTRIPAGGIIPTSLRGLPAGRYRLRIFLDGNASTTTTLIVPNTTHVTVRDYPHVEVEVY